MTVIAKHLRDRYKATWRAKNRDRINARNREWRRVHRLKYNAHKVVYKAIKAGRLFRPSICEGCGSGGRIEAAHSDYTKPYEIKWLCFKCHRIMDDGSLTSRMKSPIPVAVKDSIDGLSSPDK
jgi:hypothetical protein